MGIKVLIIDDSALVRQTMTQVLESDSQIEVIGSAPDPIVGVRMIQASRPDVIISDIEMARMDGLTFLKKINETIDPIPCVICSSLVSKDSPEAIRAYELGACEVILKPSFGTKKFIEESTIILCDAVKSAYKCTGKIKKLIPSQALLHTLKSEPVEIQPIQKIELPPQPVQNTQPESYDPSVIQPKLSADVILDKPNPNFAPTEITEPVVVIGASTGGTEALKDFLTSLPNDAPGMLIVQHMPEHFTEAFASRLNGLCKISVREAKNGEPIQNGLALIAPGNSHVLLKRAKNSYFVEVKDGPLVSRHRPSVDVLFRSAARYAGKNAIGVILTGMGDDGAKGMKEMKDSGSYNIAQDEATSIVWGMPGEAVKIGAVDKILPLQEIAHSVCNHAKIMQMSFKHLSVR